MAQGCKVHIPESNQTCDEQHQHRTIGTDIARI